MNPRNSKFLNTVTAGALVALAVLAFRGLNKTPGPPAGTDGGWGIDACLSAHVPASEVPPYLELLESSNVRWLRERGFGPTQAGVFRQLKTAGYRVLAFAGLPDGVPVTQKGNQLPEDLLAVFDQSRKQARLAGSLVDAWEMVGEPEMFYCGDLPDRVAAFQKAMYLGLKAGGAEAEGQGAAAGSGGSGTQVSALSKPASGPIVLTGALAYPPGPWLELAVANGLYAYTDAVNAHHYSFAGDLGNVVRSHREFSRRWSGRGALPVWITEAGWAQIPPEDWENAAARREQAAFIRRCAEEAVDARVPVFMPFILTHEEDPYALTESASAPFPGWTAYRDFTNSHSLPAQPLVKPPASPSAIVLQWLPNNRTCEPHKIARAYRFRPDSAGGWQPVEGAIRVFNLGDTFRTITLRRADSPQLGGDSGIALETSDRAWTVSLPPHAMRSVSIRFVAPAGRYAKELFRFAADEGKGEKRKNPISPLAFVLETPPLPRLPSAVEQLVLSPPRRDGKPDFAAISGAGADHVTGTLDPWVGINGAIPRGSASVAGRREFTFEVKPAEHLFRPPMAVARLPAGLPAATHGFLRLRAVSANQLPAMVRCDLVDRNGCRYTIVENFGRGPGEPLDRSVLLAYADFHPWFFGRTSAWDGFHPRDIREIQLRFPENDSFSETFRVTLDVASFR